MQIQIIGAHLPRLDARGIQDFITRDVADFKETMLDAIATGQSNTTSKAEAEESALELPDRLNTELQCCALFEVEVKGNNREFDPGEFHNPDTGLCGWEPAFITLDGNEILFSGYSAPPELSEFRVAFYIHGWIEPGRLTGPTGELDLPAFTPVPPRLWRLAPYQCFY